MRVISGSARGTKLLPPEGQAARPTADRAKEAMFSILQAEVPGADFLDLFSGTGAVGIEALSRGAASAVFVERSKDMALLVNKNLARAKLSEKAVVLQQDCAEAIARLGRESRGFGIIFMDPPYGKGHVEACLIAIVRHGILRPAGIIAAEMADDETAPGCAGLELFKAKRYGHCAFAFYQRPIDS